MLFPVSIKARGFSGNYPTSPSSTHRSRDMAGPASDFDPFNGLTQPDPLDPLGTYGLIPIEKLWCIVGATVLEPNGYRLRPRYREDWEPSWLATSEDPYFCEDTIGIGVSSITTSSCFMALI